MDDARAEFERLSGQLEADLIHAEFWKDQDSAAARAFFPEGVPEYLRNGVLESVEIANSMAVLRRAAHPAGSSAPSKAITTPAASSGRSSSAV